MPVVITIVVMIMVVVTTVAPLPVLLLIVLFQFPKGSIVTMILYDPLMVIDIFVTIPAMIVVVVRVVVASGCTARSRGRREECGCQ